MKRIVLLSALLTLAPTLSQAAVVDRGASGFTIENSIVVPVAPEVAWKALVNKVDEWWPKDHSWWGAEGKFSIDARAGGCFCEIAGKRSAQHMTVGFVDPPRTLRLLGGLGPLQGMGLNGAMDWTLAPVEGGTKLTLRYVAGGYTSADLAKFSDIVDHVQGLQLGALGAYLQKKGKP